MNRIIAALVAIVGTAALALPPPAAAQSGLPELQADLSHQLAVAGPADGAWVYDVTSHQQLFSERAGAMRPPASVEKLYTASTALERLGPAAQLTTAVYGIGHPAAGGVWEGNLYLRGGGDPTFGSSSFIRGHYGGAGASVQALATQLVRARGIQHVTGAIVGDESYLDTRRGEPSSGFAFDPFLEGTLSALAFNRGERGSERGQHAPAAFAAHALWATLKGRGVSIRGRWGAAATPAGAVLLAQVPSPPLAQLLGLMLPPSDNYFAETLIKDLGARFAGSGTTAAGAAVVRATVAAAFGLHPSVVDGSGLSESDRTSPEQIGSLLVALAGSPLGAVLRSHLAVAGRSGTLVHRMRGTGAAGNCQAKTGTLTGVSNLAGYCRSANGHTVTFAIFTDGIGVEAAHTVQDHMAISLADSELP
jgi:D-alanyl-D-alanine carboxypeptidase/D-alanyl-D-alanine-endopeptidase (penicillin-binding protein 4)